MTATILDLDLVDVDLVGAVVDDVAAAFLGHVVRAVQIISYFD